MEEALLYVVFFMVGVVVGCVLAIALEHGKDTIIAHFKKTTIEITRK